MIEYLLETRVDAAIIQTVLLDNNLLSTSTATTTTTTTTTTTATSTTTPTTSFSNNYSSTFASDTNTNDVLTKSCCINFSDLPLRYVDDLDVNGSGYASDGNINYYSNIKNSTLNSSSPINHIKNQLLQKQKTALQQNFQAINMFIVKNLDVSLEDFILTHVIFMPTNVLCNYLKNYYNKCRKNLKDLSLPLPPQFNIVRIFFFFKLKYYKK